MDALAGVMTEVGCPSSALVPLLVGSVVELRDSVSEGRIACALERKVGGISVTAGENVSDGPSDGDRIDVSGVLMDAKVAKEKPVSHGKR